MQVPLEISFHNLDSESRAERDIRNHVRRLEEIFERGWAEQRGTSRIVDFTKTGEAALKRTFMMA